MGYHATFNGLISFKEELTSQKMKQISALIKDTFPVGTCFSSRNEISFSGEGNYWDDTFKDALVEISKIADIETGEVEFAGDDNTFWEYYYGTDYPHWQEIPGHIVYDGGFDF